MAKPSVRIAAIQAGFALAVLALLVRAVQLQIVDGEKWAKEAERTRTERRVLPARRGALYDRNGVPLAVTQEFYHVGIAPNELDDHAAAFRALVRSLGVPAAALDREFRSGKRWIYLHGPYNATQVQPLRALSGVHLEGAFQRFYPSRQLARPIIGGLKGDGASGGAGLEMAMDSILTGRPGEAVLLKDRAGRRYDSPSRQVRDPVPGNDVVLTIDAELQEIAERGLADALEGMEAEGGDVVFLDPKTGELLALASRQVHPGAVPRASAFTDPFEPGSTAKLFTAAALLRYGLVDSTDEVFGEGGVWHMAVTRSGRVRRTIHDVHAHKGNLTLAEAIRSSSNIAMAKFSLRLSPEQQYETLRDFGFGSPTGAEFPSESRGQLAMPHRWQPMYTRASLAMGYELGVTPVQLAAAYGAIANDGLLLAPTLVKEVRSPSGRVLFTKEPEPVRRVISPEIARRLQEYLRGAVEEGGTGTEAQLVNYTVLGKTGTARRYENGTYVAGKYTSTFAAIFPADDPQLVVIVKIDNPKGSYYGGRTAAPVTRTMLQQTLASRRVSIDRGRLAPREVRTAGPPSGGGTAAAVRAPVTVIAWPYREPASATDAVAVPEVTGRSIREAALALHRRGFRMSLRGMGRVVRTMPAEGHAAAPGSSVTVWAE
ncbi:MAG TPA: penicillin-binding transpeptidase domain-containing protein [Gemmatimonadales bacterium]|nr:penicillin-binding transpeptidase domain-containing protein [Gemmatimonadales bacterium]